MPQPSTSLDKSGSITVSSNFGTLIPAIPEVFVGDPNTSLPVASSTFADGTTQGGASGTAVLWRDAGNVVHVVSPTNALPVNPQALSQSVDSMASGASTTVPAWVNGVSTAVLFSTINLFYRTVSLQLTGTWVATVVVEVSNDNTTFTALALTPAAGGAQVTSMTANGLWYGTIGAQYVRARASAYTSGTITGAAYLLS